MSTFYDEEFGEITIRRSKLSRNVKLSFAPNGQLRVSMPAYAPLFLAKRLIASSRPTIRSIQLPSREAAYEHGQQIGKSHSLVVESSPEFAIEATGQRITVLLPPQLSLADTDVQRKITAAVVQALRKEAKSYLPKRLDYLAKKHEFTYEKLRFSHASSRWGSCSSRGTISLNIALMKLPFELVDYVLLHELVHTKFLNHSHEFWSTLNTVCPDYKVHKKSIKAFSPGV